MENKVRRSKLTGKLLKSEHDLIHQRASDLYMVFHYASGSSQHIQDKLLTDVLNFVKPSIEAAVRRFYKDSYNEFQDICQQTNYQLIRGLRKRAGQDKSIYAYANVIAWRAALYHKQTETKRGLKELYYGDPTDALDKHEISYTHIIDDLIDIENNMNDTLKHLEQIITYVKVQHEVHRIVASLRFIHLKSYDDISKVTDLSIRKVKNIIEAVSKQIYEDTDVDIEELSQLFNSIQQSSHQISLTKHA